MLKWTYFKIVIFLIFAINIQSHECYYKGIKSEDFKTTIKNEITRFQEKCTPFEKDEIQQKWYLIFQSNTNLETSFMIKLLQMNDDFDEINSRIFGTFHSDTKDGKVLMQLLFDLDDLQEYLQKVMNTFASSFTEDENELWQRLADKLPTVQQLANNQRFGLLPYQVKHYVQESLKFSNESGMKNLMEKFDNIRMYWNRLKNQVRNAERFRDNANSLTEQEVDENIKIFVQNSTELRKQIQKLIESIDKPCQQHCSEWSTLSIILSDFLHFDLDSHEFIAENLYDKLLNSLKVERNKMKPQPEFFGIWENILENAKLCVSKAIDIKTALIDKKDKIPNKTSPLQKLVIFTIDAFISMIEPIASYSKKFYSCGENVLKFIGSNQQTPMQIEEINKMFMNLKTISQQQFEFLIKSLDNFKNAFDKTSTNRTDLDKLFADKYDTLHDVMKLNAKLFEKLTGVLNNILNSRKRTASGSLPLRETRSKFSKIK